MSLNQDLQHLLDAECAKVNTQSVLLRVQSGDGRVDFWGSAGTAQPDARFVIASISKMFTATLIMQLADAGQLDLDQPVQDILTDIDLSDLHVVRGVPYGKALTIRHLIHQTSGLADYYEGGLVADLKQNKDRSYGLEDVLRITKTLPPQAAPDSGKSHYSDTNYQLLGAVIEKVTGQSFDHALQRGVCIPLGLKGTGVFDANTSALLIYHKTQPLNVPLALASMGPDGGIVSTLDDLLILLRAYMTNQLFAPKNVTQMRQWNRLFFPLQYGYGLMRFKLPRWMNLFRATPELIGHSGSSGSFAFYALNPDIYLIGTFNQIDAPQRPFGFMMRVLRAVAKHEALQ
jgi:CubicO group peptidase (beta-lactamase class C family)